MKTKERTKEENRKINEELKMTKKYAAPIDLFNVTWNKDKGVWNPGGYDSLRPTDDADSVRH